MSSPYDPMRDPTERPGDPRFQRLDRDNSTSWIALVFGALVVVGLALWVGSWNHPTRTASNTTTTTEKVSPPPNQPPPIQPTPQ